MTRRYGEIRFSWELWHHSDEDKMFELFAFLSFVPFEVKYEMWKSEVILYGLSPHFRPIAEGEAGPLYTIIGHDNDGDITYEVKEV